MHMERKIISIDKLLVNPENPRFEPVKNQKEAIELMLNKVGKKILNLAENIAEFGINPSKRLMVVELEDGFFLPVDGNRRVTALKLLDKPDIAVQKDFVASFRALREKYNSKIPDAVECVVFPDKETAFRWVKLE